MNSRLMYSSVGAVIMLLSGCATQPPSVSSPVQNTTPTASSPVNTVPDLSSYNRIEIYPQHSGSGENVLLASVRFLSGKAQVEIFQSDSRSIGRLHIQPESCRENQGNNCSRNFLISGRLQLSTKTLSCTIPVREDINSGYQGQTLSGVCQSEFGRMYGLQMFSM